MSVAETDKLFWSISAKLQVQMARSWASENNSSLPSTATYNSEFKVVLIQKNPANSSRLLIQFMQTSLLPLRGLAGHETTQPVPNILTTCGD